MACLEKKERSQLVSNSKQNPSSACSLDEDCGGSSSYFCPNPSSSVHECCGNKTLAFFHGDQNPSSSPQSSSQIVSFDQNSYSARDQTYGESSSQVASFDLNPSSEIGGLRCETEEENNQN